MGEVSRATLSIFARRLAWCGTVLGYWVSASLAVEFRKLLDYVELPNIESRDLFRASSESDLVSDILSLTGLISDKKYILIVTKMDAAITRTHIDLGKGPELKSARN